MSNNPNIIILHGDDEDGMRKSLQKIAAEARSGPAGDLNYSQFEGKGMDKGAFSNAVMSMPFMTETRTVVLSNPLALAGGRDGNRKFLDQLESIPSTTTLYLVIPDMIERKDWATLGKSNFLRKWVEKTPEKARIIEKRRPAIPAMREWVIKRSQAMGGEIEPSAAQLLVASVGNDTVLASNELEKLLLYVNYERPIDNTDVEDLVTGSTSVSVFDMVDALVSGKAQAALRTLHRLLDDEEVPILFAMIVRQFRLLVQTREILDQRGGTSDVQRELSQVQFVADKLCRQSAAFTLDQLKEIYQRLLQMDYEFKTSQTDPQAALDVFIIDIAQMIKSR